MTIRYSLTRLELVRTYLFVIPRSPRIGFVVLIICLWPGMVHIATKVLFSHSFEAGDVLYVLLSVGCVFLLLLGWVFVRAKTGERTMSISDQGIQTEIGRRRATCSWGKVKQVRDLGGYILIVVRSGNAFFIPERAFTGATEKAEFLTAVDQYRNAQHRSN